MSDGKDQGAVPQGLIEQARAKSVDPGHLQMLGKQAAAIYSGEGVSLSDSVLRSIGDEDLGPEHTRRVCEFANQAAFQAEWEKGGSVRNVEFAGGPADPAYVLRELNDGARLPAEHVVSDYSTPPAVKLAADRRVEEEIFAGHTDSSPHPSEVPSGMPDMVRLRETISGAQDHIFSKVAGLEVTKEALAKELGDLVSDEVLRGTPLYKVAAAWVHFTDDKQSFREALGACASKMIDRGMGSSLTMEKFAGVATGKIPNPEHPVISGFIEFAKVAQQIRVLRQAGEVLQEQLEPVNEAIKTGSLVGGALRSAVVPAAAGAGIGALASDPGNRGTGALKGALIGGGLGAGLGLGFGVGRKKALDIAQAAGGPTHRMADMARKGDPWARQAVVSQLRSMPVKDLQRMRSSMGTGTLVGGAGGLGAGIIGANMVGGRQQ